MQHFRNILCNAKRRPLVWTNGVTTMNADLNHVVSIIANNVAVRWLTEHRITTVSWESKVAKCHEKHGQQNVFKYDSFQ